jgi:predicted permease
MAPLSRLRSFLRFVFRRRAVEQQMDDELAAHLAQRADALARGGVPRAEAERRARAELGSVVAVKDEMRDASSAAMALDGWTKDVEHALRRMRRAPGFTAVAALTLALGIGGTSAIFSVVKAVLLDPPPYRDPARLVLLWNQLRDMGVARAPGSGHELAELRARASSFAGIAGIWAGNGTLAGDEGEPEQLKVGSVTGNFFAVLGARAALGRVVEPGDEGQGRGAVLLLGHGLWQRRFGGDPGVVGRTVRLDGDTATVIGVMPEGFRMVFPPDAQVPPEIQAWSAFRRDLAAAPRDLYYLRFVARLAPEVTVAAAHAEVAAIGRALAAEFTEYGRDGLGLAAVAMHGDATREIRPALVALFAGVALVLLIACVNVASLLLARGGERGREMAVRAALGASRGRLVRQLLLESLALAVVGGALGLLLGAVCLDRLAALAPPGVLPPEPLALDRGVLGFAAGIIVLSGVLFGVAPALAGSRVDLAGAMKSEAGAPPPRRRARAALVVAEVALGFVLLVGAGLMIRTFAAVRAVDPGLRADGVLSFEVSLPGRRYPGGEPRARFARALEDQLRAIPGVTAAGAISHLPFDDYPNWYAPVTAPGEGAPRELMADHRAATAGYLDALGASRIAGRTFDAADEAAGRLVVVVDERLAGEAWPGEDPIGKRLAHERMDSEGGFESVTSEVVGVVRHVHQQRLTHVARGQLYIPYALSPREHLAVLVRGPGDPAALAAPARRVVAGLDADMAVAKVRPLAAYLERAARPARFSMVLATIFGALALLLGAVGIYGVVATSVTQRRRELGVRMALGAEPRDLLRQVLREGLGMALVGIGLGAAGALVVARLLGALLFGVSALDPGAYLLAAAVLVAAALVATWLPARRAARTSPMVTLRCD